MVFPARLIVGTLLLVFIALGLLYSAVTPLFEAPDAYSHFAVIEHIARTGQRPPTANAKAQAWKQMAFHAPLYYYTSAVLISGLDASDFLSTHPRNPHRQIGNAGADDNQNFAAHAGDTWQGAGLAVHLVRFYSLFLGVLTCLGTYWLARGLAPGTPWLAALAVLLLIVHPQFVFLNGVVTNDVMVTACSTLSLALTVHIVRYGLTWRRVGVLGILVGCASLAKASGLSVVPIAGLGVLWTAYHHHLTWRKTAVYVVLMGVLWAIIAGWWYAENWITYGDPFGTQHIVEVTGERVGSVDIEADVRALFYSYWGLFGWFTIMAPQWFYTWAQMLLAISGIGIALSLWRAWRQRTFKADDLALVGLMIVAVTILLVSWWTFNQRVLASQGRLLFPAVGIIASGIAWGLLSLIRAFRHIHYGKFIGYGVAGGLLAGMGLATITFPFTVIAPTFDPGEQIPVAEWTPLSDAISVNFREPWNDTACLTLWIAPPPVQASATVLDLDLVWETHCPLTGFWSEFVHIVPGDDTAEGYEAAAIIAQYDSMPLQGNLPLPAFKPGHVVQETVQIDLPATFAAVDVFRISIGLYDATGTFIRMVTDSPTDNHVELVIHVSSR
ncbi:MAG: hypothetical protein JXA10_17820 [Anaerolineae bacterium]|nr:hypothetical protein [Anaerolineae bacterium]